MIADAHDDEPGPVVPWSLLDDLARLIPAETVSVCELDMVNQRRDIEQFVDADNPRVLETVEPEPSMRDPFWAHYPTFWAR